MNCRRPLTNFWGGWRSPRIPPPHGNVCDAAHVQKARYLLSVDRSAECLMYEQQKKRPLCRRITLPQNKKAEQCLYVRHNLLGCRQSELLYGISYKSHKIVSIKPVKFGLKWSTLILLAGMASLFKRLVIWRSVYFFFGTGSLVKVRVRVRVGLG